MPQLETTTHRPPRQTTVQLVACALLLGRLELVPEAATIAELEAGISAANRLRWEQGEETP